MTIDYDDGYVIAGDEITVLRKENARLQARVKELEERVKGLCECLESITWRRPLPHLDYSVCVGCGARSDDHGPHADNCPIQLALAGGEK